MRRFSLTRAAKADLVEIRDFLDARSRSSSDRVVGELRDAMKMLARMPEMGHLREDLADEPLRFWPVYSYLIIYRSTTKPIEVVRVLHASRDVRKLLRK